MTKIIPYENLDSYLPTITDRKIVLVGGCFDILHPGHIAFLTAAKKQGDFLFVMLESDENVKKWKGETRPLNTQKVRGKALEKIQDVDAILLLPPINTDLEYYNIVKKIEPDIIAVTAGDPTYNKKVEQAKMVGGRVVEVINRLPHSTTDLMKS